ncbi:MAG TPA: hypothetical protein DDY82_01240 [Clostridiales bacterium]|nr:hypothetical protein [Clostridiales bacterium]HBJ97682.1 hypothetical protein [Clostridiales bacterium]
MTGLKEKEVGFISELVTIEDLFCKKSQSYMSMVKDEKIKEQMGLISSMHKQRISELLKNLD